MFFSNQYTNAWVLLALHHFPTDFLLQGYLALCLPTYTITYTGLNEMVKGKPQEGYVIPGRFLITGIKEKWKWSWDLIVYHAVGSVNTTQACRGMQMQSVIV